jgi:hypothetical protein
VLDREEGLPHEGVGYLSFTGDGARLTYEAKDGAKWVVVSEACVEWAEPPRAS